MTQAWKNNDGLYLKYGTDKTTANTGGEYKTFGDVREVELKLDLTTLNQTETVQSDTVFFPKGVRIQEVEVITTEIAATGTAIDVGLVKTDRTTEIDFQGFLSAFPLASMSAAGEKWVLTKDSGFTGIGDLIGTTTADVGYITASATTGTAFTTGKIRIRIRYYVI